MAASRVVERRIVTVLFADLVGFTSLSEKLDAEDVSIVQDAYFDAVRDTVARYGGVLEKFIGDAVMAVFGAPKGRDDDVERAVRAGLALVGAVSRLGSSLGLDDALGLRVGVNSGEAVYGEATPERGPVTGDTVNVAARLQAAAEPGSVVVGELSALAAADAVELEPLPPLELKGKGEPVRAWRVVGLYPEPSRERALGLLRAPMLGRDDELARLVSLLGDGSHRVLVVAPPGVGKSRLLRELAASAEAGGALVLTARLRPDALAPFEPVGQLVHATGPLDSLEPRLLEAGVAPLRAGVVAEALAAPAAPPDDPLAVSADERARLFEAWREGLDALAAGAPSLWLVEDVHWASADFLAFLDAASRVPVAAGRLVVVSSRPALLEREPDWCRGAETLDLPPLEPADTADLVRALVGDALPAELVARVAEHSAGNPLFVEELLRTWATVGVLALDEDGCRLVAPAESVALPATVQAIYAAQLDDLPGPARTLARKAAVAGRRFPLAAFEPLEIPPGEEALSTLVRRAFVAGPDEDAALGPSYTYRHALLRDAGYASLSRGDRARLHARLAAWLSALPDPYLPSVAEVVARHYAAALEHAPSLAREIDGRPREAIASEAAAWFERGAEAAARLGAWQSARELALRAVELTADGPVDRGRRLGRVAEATAAARSVDEALAVFEEALGCYRAAARDDPLAARTGIAAVGAAMGNLLRAQARFAEGERLAVELLRELGPPDDDPPSARLLILRALAVLNAYDDYDRAEGDAGRALAVARTAGDEELELEALQVVAQAVLERGDRPDEELEAAWADVERLARRGRRWEAAVSALRVRAALPLDEDPDATVERIEAASELAAAHGLVEQAAWCDYLRAEAHFLAGRWDEALETGLRAIGLGADHGLLRVVVRSWFVLLPLARARGRDDLIGAAHEAFSSRPSPEPTSHYARVITTSAHLHFASAGLEPPFVPDVEERLPSFALAHGGPSWLAAVENVVETWLAAGEVEAAELALDTMRARLARGPTTAFSLGTEALLRARLLLARGAPAQDEARRALETLPPHAPWWRLKAMRVLEQAGGAVDEAEAERLERLLGLAP